MLTDHKLSDKFLTTKELSLRWKLSQQTIKRRRRSGVLTAHHFGRAVRFSLSEILKIENEASSLTNERR